MRLQIPHVEWSCLRLREGLWVHWSACDFLKSSIYLCSHLKTSGARAGNHRKSREVLGLLGMMNWVQTQQTDFCSYHLIPTSRHAPILGSSENHLSVDSDFTARTWPRPFRRPAVGARRAQGAQRFFPVGLWHDGRVDIAPRNGRGMFLRTCVRACRRVRALVRADRLVHQITMAERFGASFKPTNGGLPHWPSKMPPSSVGIRDLAPTWESSQGGTELVFARRRALIGSWKRCGPWMQRPCTGRMERMEMEGCLGSSPFRIFQMLLS